MERLADRAESLRAQLSSVSSLAMLLNQMAVNDHNFKSKIKTIQGFPNFPKGLNKVWVGCILILKTKTNVA